MTVVFRAQALAEAAEAKQWYEAEAGLGAAFEGALTHALRRLADFPMLGPVVNQRGARRILLRRFPYVVFYRIRGTQLVVLAVFHVARDPASVSRRLR